VRGMVCQQAKGTLASKKRRAEHTSLHKENTRVMPHGRKNGMYGLSSQKA